MTTRLPCEKCGALILPSTAERTGGKCMPCAQGQSVRKPADPDIFCRVEGMDNTELFLVVKARDLQPVLEAARHVGDSMHANKYELEAQRALVRHAIRYDVSFLLHDDHWMCTGWALLSLFEAGKAYAKIAGDGKLFFADLQKKDWQEGTDPLAMRGGFEYLDMNGTVVFKIRTWIS